MLKNACPESGRRAASGVLAVVAISEMAREKVFRKDEMTKLTTIGCLNKILSYGQHWQDVSFVEFIVRIEGSDLITLSQCGIVEHRLHKVGQPATHPHDGLAYMNQFSRALPYGMNS